jgi:hypothetical protein
MLKKDVIDDIQFEKAIEVAVRISLWSGQATIKPEDLGVNAKDLPPEELSKFGPTKLLKGEHLKKLRSLRDSLGRDLAKFCRPWLVDGLYVTDISQKDHTIALLEDRKQKFESLSAAFLSDLDNEVGEWVSMYPKYEQAIRNKLPSVAEIDQQCTFRYAIKPVTFWGEDENAPENRDSMSVAKGWTDQVYSEIQTLAAERLEFLSGKKECRQDSLNPLRVDIVQKLQGASFVSPRIRTILARVTGVLTHIPHHLKKIEDRDLSAVLGLLLFLTNIAKMKAYADAVIAGDASVLDMDETPIRPVPHQNPLLPENDADDAKAPVATMLPPTRPVNTTESSTAWF